MLSHMHAANKISFAAAGAIKPLVQLLEHGQPRGQEHAGHALASIAFDNNDNLKQVTMLLVGLLGSGDLTAKSTAAMSLWQDTATRPARRRTLDKTTDALSRLHAEIEALRAEHAAVLALRNAGRMRHLRPGPTAPARCDDNGAIRPAVGQRRGCLDSDVACADRIPELRPR